MSTAVKLGFEFSDPTGQLAPRNEPINMWISAALSSPTGTKFDDIHVQKKVQGETCIYTPYHKPKIYDDMHDSDQKGVLVEKADLTITPSGNDQDWIVKSTFEEGCIATVNFDVPGKPNPPPRPLILSIWGMASIAGAVKDGMLYTEEGKGAPINTPVNVWVPPN